MKQANAVSGRALLGCAVAAGLLLPPSAGAGADTLTVATFNAAFLTRPKVHLKFGHRFDLRGADRKTWQRPGYRDAKFAEATERVARYIADHVRADILVLTEAGGRRDVAELTKALAGQKRRLDFPHFAVCDCRAGRTAQHVAVLSRLPLSDVLRSLPGREGYRREPDDPETEAHTGIARGMRVRVTAAGRALWIYAVHLTSEADGHPGDGHAKDAQRIAQASILRRLTLGRLNAGEHVIVAGDLNDRRGDPALRRVRGLDDIWPDLIQTGRHEYFDKSSMDQRWTYMYRGQREQIDHILLSQSLAAAVRRNRGRTRGIRAAVGPTPDRAVSDHRPFIVTLAFR